MWDFLQHHWAVIALITSEVLAFVPSKVNSIGQVVLKIGQFLFGNKENKTSKSAKTSVSMRNSFHS